MTYLSLLDKIKILFSVLYDFKGVFIFGILILILTILYLLKKISVKRYTIGMVLSLILVFLISILTNLKILSKTFDNFMTVFFTGIYFPSIYLYISTLFIVFVGFLFSIINVKIRKVYKVINRVMFVVNNIIFVIILNIIAKNKIDIFSINSLYTNTNLVAILEISMGIFLIWIASLAIAYTTNSICDRMLVKSEVKLNEVDNKEEYVLLDNVVDDSENYNEVSDTISTNENVSSYAESNSLVSECIEEVKDEDDKVIDNNEVSSVITFDDILNGKIEVNYYDNNNENIEYSISNPQEVYESHYNSVKFQDLVDADETIEIKKVNTDNVMTTDNSVIKSPSVEELTYEIKSKKAVENLFINTISLNELVDEEVLEDVKVIDKANESLDSNNYTVEDYKKIIGMLNALRKHSVDHNITIDDAVAISLISNYSIDDCLKFKDILKSTLN